MIRETFRGDDGYTEEGYTVLRAYSQGHVPTYNSTFRGLVMLPVPPGTCGRVYVDLSLLGLVREVPI